MSSQERALVEKTLNALQNKAENAVAAKLLSEEVLGSTDKLDVNHLLFVGGGQLHGRFQLVVCSCVWPRSCSVQFLIGKQREKQSGCNFRAVL